MSFIEMGMGCSISNAKRVRCVAAIFLLMVMGGMQMVSCQNPPMSTTAPAPVQMAPAPYMPPHTVQAPPVQHVVVQARSRSRKPSHKGPGIGKKILKGVIITLVVVAIILVIYVLIAKFLDKTVIGPASFGGARKQSRVAEFFGLHKRFKAPHILRGKSIREGPLSITKKLKVNNYEVPIVEYGNDDGRPWVLYFHSSQSNVRDKVTQDMLMQLRSIADVNICSVGYPGYVEAGGAATVDQVSEMARQAYDYLHTNKRIKADNIIVMGSSIGSGVAARLVSNDREAPLLVLHAPIEGQLTCKTRSNFQKYMCKALGIIPWAEHYGVGKLIKSADTNVCILNPSEDPITESGAAERLAKQFKEGHDRQAQIINYTGKHNLWEDKENRTQTFQKLSHWIESTLESRGSLLVPPSSDGSESEDSDYQSGDESDSGEEREKGSDRDQGVGSDGESDE